MYEEEKNLEEAEKFLILAARTDVPVAQYNLGIAYYWEKIKPKNSRIKKDAEAAKWIIKSAAAMREGKLVAGYLFYKGIGIEQNFSKSFEWFLKAYEEGDYFCSFIIAYYYSAGIGTPDGIVDIPVARDIIVKESKRGSLLASSLRHTNDSEFVERITEIASKSLENFTMTNITSPKIYEPSEPITLSKLSKNKNKKEKTPKKSTKSISFVNMMKE